MHKVMNGAKFHAPSWCSVQMCDCQFVNCRPTRTPRNHRIHRGRNDPFRPNGDLSLQGCRRKSIGRDHLVQVRIFMRHMKTYEQRGAAATDSFASFKNAYFLMNMTNPFIILLGTESTWIPVIRRLVVIPATPTHSWPRPKTTTLNSAVNPATNLAQPPKQLRLSCQCSVSFNFSTFRNRRKWILAQLPLLEFLCSYPVP